MQAPAYGCAQQHCMADVPTYQLCTVEYAAPGLAGMQEPAKIISSWAICRVLTSAVSSVSGSMHPAGASVSANILKERSRSILLYGNCCGFAATCKAWQSHNHTIQSKEVTQANSSDKKPSHVQMVVCRGPP
eukprot:GHRR01026525.1.p2 GENE.GHRR01026525.1~~GHRR01026525.1.p2  ORF type:complete len:132 (+),score=29.39 GHRR01026525.1:32-427(+)